MILNGFNRLKKIAKIASIIIIAFIAFLVILTFTPLFGKYQAFVVTSSSMSPAIKSGSLILTEKSNNYKKNDIISFRMRTDPRSFVTHRIVSVQKIKNTIWYQVKGDAVKHPDLELVKSDLVIGKLILTIPYLGLPIAFAKTQLGVVILVVIPASIIVYEEFKRLINEIKKVKNRLGKLEQKRE